jgi:hypothetical protein
MKHQINKDGILDVTDNPHRCCGYWKELDTEIGTQEYCTKLERQVACCGTIAQCEYDDTTAEESEEDNW